MTTATETKDEVQEIEDSAAALVKDEGLSRPDAAYRVLHERFRTAPAALVRLAQIGLIQNLGLRTHIENTATARGSNGHRPAANVPGHIVLTEGAKTRATITDFLANYRFVGADGHEVVLDEARYEDLDLRARTEYAQGEKRISIGNAFATFRDAVGEGRAVPDLPIDVKMPLASALRDAVS